MTIRGMLAVSEMAFHRSGQPSQLWTTDRTGVSNGKTTWLQIAAVSRANPTTPRTPTISQPRSGVDARAPFRSTAVATSYTATVSTPGRDSWANRAVLPVTGCSSFATGFATNVWHREAAGTVRC